MKYLTHESFLEQVEYLKKQNPTHWGHTEYKPSQPRSIDRWSYHKKAIEILKKIQPKSVLEAGSMGIFLTDSSDSIDLDIPEWGWRLSYTPTYNHDLTHIPWAGITDKQYDVFVALRVFHHMEDQERFLKEMERISDHIILAFPQYASDVYESIKTPTEKYHFDDTDTTVIYYHNKL
jgi:hypothetical protein